MRVIAGTARSLPLKAVPGNGTRPTTDRIKETLFNIIADRIPGCRFLDLFAGSGAIGIEALSRGAAFSVFVESDRKAQQVIRANLEFTHLKEKARIIGAEAVRTVQSMDGEAPFDIIFMDPPYDNGLERKVMEALRATSLVSGNTLLIAEASKGTDVSWAQATGYEVVREKHYGSNRHVFFKPACQEEME